MSEWEDSMYTCQFEHDFAIWLDANPSFRVIVTAIVIIIVPYVYRMWRSSSEP